MVIKFGDLVLNLVLRPTTHNQAYGRLHSVSMLASEERSDCPPPVSPLSMTRCFPELWVVTQRRIRRYARPQCPWGTLLAAEEVHKNRFWRLPRTTAARMHRFATYYLNSRNAAAWRSDASVAAGISLPRSLRCMHGLPLQLPGHPLRCL